MVVDSFSLQTSAYVHHPRRIFSVGMMLAACPRLPRLRRRGSALYAESTKRRCLTSQASAFVGCPGREPRPGVVHVSGGPHWHLQCLHAPLLQADRASAGGFDSSRGVRTTRVSGTVHLLGTPSEPPPSTACLPFTLTLTLTLTRLPYPHLPPSDSGTLGLERLPVGGRDPPLKPSVLTYFFY